MHTVASMNEAGMNSAHTLPMKLRAIAEAGFPQVEIGFPDLEAYASQAFPGYKELDNSGKGDLYNLLKTAKEIRELCRELGLKVLVVHPFSEFEGYDDERKRKENMTRARAWFKVLAALDCQMLQVGSSDDPSSSSDLDVMARDLRVLADEAAAQEPPIKIAYEMWAWGAHVNTWEHTWEVCKRVDRPNLGLCLDTFQISARAYADPTSSDGRLLAAQDRLADSLSALSNTIPPEKIFYFQISDGSHKHGVDALKASAQKQGIDPLYAWSNAWRPLPFQDEIEGKKGDEGYGGYLPVVEICEAVVRTGWRGPWSFEVFYEKDMSRDDPEVPRRWARSAKASYEKIEGKLRERGL
ncbi:xylose isomerase-like protein [Rhodofomes roseus]|uniref:Xylose isomerase-like protein n=1 Tax=Rhodofomes roseus TaxID=34475 RepID=A0ABQ8KEY9_9APHY|nr:xylose isomerase-like protein [Rhodofomes roseus]KAH9836277.1 xylose isomerase-like protein [Rhodofomes roseus]